jgi:SAM-dependent methyltransferase
MSEPHATPPSPADGSLELRTTRWRSVKLRFVDLPPRLYVGATSGGSRWLAEALEAGACWVRRRGGDWGRSSAVRVVDLGERTAAQRAFVSKYGSELWGRHFDGPTVWLRLVSGAAATPPSPADRLKEEFDDAARLYEARLAHQPVERALKRRTLRILLDRLAGLDPLLEIGPGVGLETIPLLEAGHRVTAVDVSGEMLHELSARARRAGVADRLTVATATLGGLGSRFAASEAGQFAAVYSTFGAFNLEPDVGAVGPGLGRLLRPGGRLLFTTLNRPGPVAIGWELLVGRVGPAGARLRPRIPAGAIRYPLTVYARRPSEWDALLAGPFQRVGARAVSVLAPPFEPSRAREFLQGSSGIRLERLDRGLSRRRSLTEFGEWSMLEYVRLDVPPTAPAGLSQPRE